MLIVMTGLIGTCLLTFFFMKGNFITQINRKVGIQVEFVGINTAAQVVCVRSRSI